MVTRPKWMTVRSDGVLVLHLSVQPKASHPGVAGQTTDQARLRVRVSSPPDKGRANADVIEVVAKAIGVAKRDVTIIRGELSRQKDVAVTSKTPEQIVAILGPLLMKP